MRVLDKNEVSEVSGGTFCLIGGLVSGLFGLLRPRNSCAPVQNTCAPVQNTCAPKPRRGC